MEVFVKISIDFYPSLPYPRTSVFFTDSYPLTCLSILAAAPPRVILPLFLFYQS